MQIITSYILKDVQNKKKYIALYNSCDVQHATFMRINAFHVFENVFNYSFTFIERHVHQLLLHMLISCVYNLFLHIYRETCQSRVHPLFLLMCRETCSSLKHQLLFLIYGETCPSTD